MSCGSKRPFSISHVSLNNNSHIPNKKKKKAYKRVTTFVPPTKFLLGGNIRDPLNLNGLQEEDETVLDVTKDEVLPTSTDFLLGGNINDPLNLKGIAEEESEVLVQECASPDQAEIPREVEATELVVEKTDEPSKEQEKCPNVAPKVVNLHLHITSDCRPRRLDKIVSPVIPQPYRPLKTVPFRQIITPDLANKAAKTPKFKEKNTRFQYGNYHQYYDNRNLDNGIDLRLQILEKHRDFFESKDVLDIGCNIGHISFIIARSFGAKSVTGIDIDRYLIDMAKRNVQYYVNCPSPYSLESPSTATPSHRKVNLKYKCYPVSMPILYGPVYDDVFKADTQRIFPKNLRFVHGNYVLESEALLQNEQPQFDTILCLRVTKWIHLNWGDTGLKLAFKRMFAQLRPGGLLVVEPQSWDSYKKKKNLTETIWENYKSMKLFPHHFDRYLLSEVGFTRCYTVGVVDPQNTGFRRSIKVFKKPIPSSSHFVSPFPVKLDQLPDG